MRQNFGLAFLYQNKNARVSIYLFQSINDCYLQVFANVLLSVRVSVSYKVFTSLLFVYVGVDKCQSSMKMQKIRMIGLLCTITHGFFVPYVAFY